MRERLTRIDELNGKLEERRTSGLDAENEHLMEMVVEMVRLPRGGAP